MTEKLLLKPKQTRKKRSKLTIRNTSNFKLAMFEYQAQFRYCLDQLLKEFNNKNENNSFFDDYLDELSNCINEMINEYLDRVYPDNSTLINIMLYYRACNEFLSSITEIYIIENPSIINHV